jgi:pyrophosphatase PpaX
MDDLFDVIITGDDVTNPKPHPEGIFKALSLLGVRNNEVMYIGDSDADIQAGSEANVHTVGVRWLQDYQTSEFKIEPNSFFYSVHHFLDFINIGSRYEL